MRHYFTKGRSAGGGVMLMLIAARPAFCQARRVTLPRECAERARNDVYFLRIATHENT